MLPHRLGRALVGLFAGGVVLHPDVGRDIPVHGVDRRADVAAKRHAPGEARVEIRPPAVAHLVHGGIGQYLVQEDGIGQRTCPRVVPAGTVGIFHILAQQVEAHRVAVAPGHVGDQEGHSFALLARGLPQQIPQAVGARAAGQRGIQQRFVSGGDTAAVTAAGTETRPQQKEDDAFHGSSRVSICRMSRSSAQRRSYSETSPQPPIETCGLRKTMPPGRTLRALKCTASTPVAARCRPSVRCARRPAPPTPAACRCLRRPYCGPPRSGSGGIRQPPPLRAPPPGRTPCRTPGERWSASAPPRRPGQPYAARRPARRGGVSTPKTTPSAPHSRAKRTSSSIWRNSVSE